MVVGAVAAVLAGAQEIHLKTRDIPGVVSPGARGAVLPGPQDIHQLVLFDHTPNVEDLDALLAEGATVVSVIPDNAVVVSSPGSVVPLSAGIVSVTRLDPKDKISPALGTSSPYTAIVEFHTDVTVDRQNVVAQDEGLTLQRPAVLNPNHAIVTGTLANLQALAAHDEVAYVFPADPALLNGSSFNICAGMLTLSGPIAQYSNLVHGWNTGADGIAHLSYYFGTLTPAVAAQLVQSEIMRALNTWSQYTNVAFQSGTSATAARTVAIEFASGAHGDAYPFEGPGGQLAHTFYPVPVNPESIAGDMHFNADENWHVGGDVDIYSVALHEAGHAIGLGHSDNPGDVMYPYYRRGMSLSANDIGAAQALYGMPVSSTLSGPAAPVTAAPVTTAPALRLTLDAVPTSTSATQLSTTGTVAGGAGPYTVQWQTDHGYSGKASFGNTQSFTASGIALVNGENTVTLTAFDSNDETSSQTITVNMAPAAATVAAPSSGPVAVSVTTPSASMFTTGAATLSLAGTASGGAGIVKVTWQTSTGSTGTASGTAHWITSSIPLLVGTNTIVVRAYDANGANAWAAVVAVRN